MSFHFATTGIDHCALICQFHLRVTKPSTTTQSHTPSPVPSTATHTHTAHKNMHNLAI